MRARRADAQGLVSSGRGRRPAGGGRAGSRFSPKQATGSFSSSGLVKTSPVPPATFYFSARMEDRTGRVEPSSAVPGNTARGGRRPSPGPRRGGTDLERQLSPSAE